MSYVHSRLFDDAAEITQTRRERDYVNLYRIINDFLKELAQLFNDLNKKVNFRREYYNLIQEFKKFNEFYTQFQRLFFYLDYHEKQLIADLKDKIHFRLQFIWINQLVQSDSLKKIRFYLIHLNNDQRVVQKIKNKIKRVNDLSKTIFHRWTVVTQSVDHVKSDQCYERIKTEQDWSSNQFASGLTQIWLRYDSDMTQHSFSFSTFFSFINILFIYITFFSCHKHISFRPSAVSEHYINRSFCINLLLYS